MRSGRFFVVPPRGSWIGVVLACAALAVAGPFAVAPAGAEVKLVSSDATRLVFELNLEGFRFEASPFLAGTERLEIPDFGTLTGEGEPRLPGRYYMVALPPEGRYSLRSTIVRSQPLGRHRLEPAPSAVAVRDGADFVTTREIYRIDDSVYGQKRYTIGVTDAGVGRVRHQRIVSLRVDPVAYDPATGETVLATTIRIEVSFTPAGRSRLDSGREGALRPVPESDVWDRILSGMLVNPVQARTWRAAPRRSTVYRETARAALALAGPVVKLQVTESRMHRVSAASVIAEGFPAGTATVDLHLFKRSYDDAILAERIVDVAYKVVEDPAGTGGTFDGNDYMIFYGQQLRDDTLQDDPIQKFTDDNTYWLGASTGPQMSPKTVAAGFVTGDTTSASFPVTRRFERDLWFREETPPLERDFFYYHNPRLQSFSAPFVLDAIDGGDQFRVKARFLGADRNVISRVIRVRIINSKGTTVLNQVSVPRNTLINYDSGPMPAGSLVEGLNTFRITPDAANQASFLDVLLNWFDLEYQSPYRAKGNVLDFHTASLAGDTSLTVTGLSRPDVMLFDVTDPLAPRECQLGGGHVTPVGGGWVLSFRETLASQRRYIVTPLDKIKEISGGDVISDVDGGLIDNPARSGVDILVVSHRNFLGEMQRWVDYRKSQGYRVLMADAAEIYDEFNGGVNHPRAIRRFIRHFFENGNASFVVLVGDSNEDNKRVHGTDSGINFVPTESFTEFVGAGFNEDEVVTTDKWYVMLGHDFIKIPLREFPLPNPVNFIPSLIIGRLPAGNTTELRRMIDKTIAFEQPEAGDLWRRRMIRIADDAWSFQNFGSTCLQPGESGFEIAEESASVITENSIPNKFDIVRFFLSEKIGHPVPPNCVSSFLQQQRTRTIAVPQLIAELNRGATIVSFQAHMNRYAICHEFLFTSTTNLGETPDYLKMANFGKPWVLFAMGCHLSDYALHKEPIRFQFNGPNGDCLSELLLFRNNNGAVATYGSTGFEYLSTNAAYTNAITEEFFEHPRSDTQVASSRAQARWIFGELMTDAELVNLVRRGAGPPGKGSVGMIIRYHILGDPLLRIDAGPPRFEVTVDGRSVETESPLIASAGSDSVQVRAVISDEVAIDSLTLEIAGVDASNQLTRTPLVDQGLDAARQYEVTFTHRILPAEYDVILRAHQAVDTTGSFLMVGEFVLKVGLEVGVKVNGRPLVSGDIVPPRANYLVELTASAVLDTSLIRVKIDSTRVSSVITPPAPGDTTNTWLIGFSADLARGPHTITVLVDRGAFSFNVVVSSQLGLRDVIAYPNPFRDKTQFVYTNEVAISGGNIDIFTTSGKKVAQLGIPLSARAVGQNAVAWDGRTFSGAEIANGVYLFVITIDQPGGQSTFRGKLVHVK